MTAVAAEPAVTGKPRNPPGETARLRITLDIEEWWWWTRIIGLTSLQAQERLEFSEKRAARYERHLRETPLTLEDYLTRPIQRWTDQPRRLVRRVSWRGLSPPVGK